ncbi:hypothetical protein PENSPDRAFT_645453 [Peniophora sp. CONT]|nr:hypothetical protein PENSPDRAFT_645453 [Peniophora sp. CONT]
MKTASILTIAGVTLVSGAIAYAVYFDSKRRTDAAFRKKLRKDKKKVDKSAASQQAASAAASTASLGPLNITEVELRAAIETVKKEELPASPEAKEQYFMQQVNMGETLCAQGPAFSLTAAMCFFRALRVYPSPVELLMIYQQTVPEPVFKLVVEMTQLDVKTRVEGYWDVFPPKEMNVTAQPVDIESASGAAVRKRVLVATKDFKAGDVIYTEEPVVTALDADLEGKGLYCSHCIRPISPDSAIRPPEGLDKFGPTYCSKECELKSVNQSQGLLFGTTSPVPETELTPEMIAKRAEAQDVFVSRIRAEGKTAALLVARFNTRQVSGELSKMFPGMPGEPATVLGLTDFTIYDHIERLRYLEVTPEEEELVTFRSVLESVLPGLDQFITEERYATLKGQMLYNAYGVYYGEGRDEKPDDGLRPEDKERTRCAVGTARQVGSAFYFVSSYCQHDCDPSARAVFTDTATLRLTATRDIASGEEITVAYVDTTAHPDESVVDARRRRRMELARGWRFPCPCKRCQAEAPAEAEREPAIEDESKIEPAFERKEEEDKETFQAAIDE